MFTVMIVDDDPATVGLLVTQLLFLKNRAFHIIVAGNPNEALMIMNSNVKLVISDMMMPGMTGFELIQIIKQEYPTIKTILISANNDIDSIRDCSINLTIQKPLTIDDITSIVDLSDKSNLDLLIQKVTLDIASIKSSIKNALV